MIEIDLIIYSPIYDVCFDVFRKHGVWNKHYTG